MFYIYVEGINIMLQIGEAFKLPSLTRNAIYFL